METGGREGTSSAEEDHGGDEGGDAGKGYLEGEDPHSL